MRQGLTGSRLMRYNLGRMSHKPVSKLTPEEAAKRRSYMAQKKRESRDRQREEGLCIIKDAGCEIKAKPGGTTCTACDQAAAERAKARAKKIGRWPIIPSKQIPRIIRNMRRSKATVNQILQHPYLREYGVGRDEVSEVLRKAGMLE